MFFIFTGSALGENGVKIIINKKVNKLAYLKDGEVVKILPVATGKSPGLTPEGSFNVIRKIVNPYYSKKKIAGGSPRNPLGVRWLGLNALGTPGNTYGIHGTNNPKSIGKYASGGCIRMYNKDAIWLYSNTPVGTGVDIINREWDLEQKPITVMINGKKLTSIAGAKPYMINNRIMVPCRPLAESLGCIVTWSSALQQVVLTNGSVSVKATVGFKQITVNDATKIIDEPVTLSGNTVYIPVRAFAEAFGCKVAWNKKNFTVNLDKSVVSESEPSIPVVESSAQQEPSVRKEPVQTEPSAAPEPTVTGTVYVPAGIQDADCLD